MLIRTPGILLTTLIAGAALCGCASPEPLDVGPALPAEPIIRVRIASSVEQVQLAGPPLLLAVRSGEAAPTVKLTPPITLRFDGSRWHTGGSPAPALGDGAIDIKPAGDAPTLAYADRRYPGTLRLWPLPRRVDADRVALDVIDLVHLEAYLPGVLAKELYDDWQLTTYYAQAIAARSYAIHRLMNRSSTSAYDVEATQLSQAYIGATDNPKATRAVLETTGLVLTWNNQVMPALYHSTCGGTGASPTDAFGNPDPWQPLVPVAHPPWCERSKHYRWGPIRRDRHMLGRRIAAWGEQRGHAIAELGSIMTLVISQRNALGRPARFTLSDDRGKRYTLSAEAFRAACNFPAPQAPSRGDRLKSAHVDVRLDVTDVVFRDGRGFGHGVGMCQFGAEGQARAGRDVRQILQTYYPGATLERVY